MVMGGSTIVRRGWGCGIVTSDDVGIPGGCGYGDDAVNAGAARMFHPGNAGLSETRSPKPGGKSWSWGLTSTGNWSTSTTDGVSQSRTHNNANPGVPGQARTGPPITGITRSPGDLPDLLHGPAGCNVFGPKPNDDANPDVASGLDLPTPSWPRYPISDIRAVSPRWIFGKTGLHPDSICHILLLVRLT